MPKHRWPWPLLTVAVISIGAVAVMGCTAQSGRTSVDASEPGPLSAGASAATPNLPVRDVELTLPAAGAFPPGWTRDFAVPYGAASDKLGVAPDHGGAATPWGPEFAAPGSDGTWWVLDVQKSRVARYGPAGGFLGETPIPRPNPDVWAPRILGDWLYASGDPALLSSTTTAVRVREPFPFHWTYDDGTTAYSPYGDNTVYSLREVGGALVTGRGQYMLTPNGQRFRFATSGQPNVASVFELELPDATPAVRLRLHLTSARSGGPLEASVEVAADSDGTIYLYLVADDNGTQVAAVTATGYIAYTEQTANPFHAGDPGSVAGRLHVVPGSRQPSLVFDEEHAMAIYSRTSGAQG